MKDRNQQHKEQIRKQMGAELFERVYKVLCLCKDANDTDQKMLREHLKQVQKMSSQMKDLCFALEQIVYMEDWTLYFN